MTTSIETLPLPADLENEGSQSSADFEAIYTRRASFSEFLTHALVGQKWMAVVAPLNFTKSESNVDIVWDDVDAEMHCGDCGSVEHFVHAFGRNCTIDRSNREFSAILRLHCRRCCTFVRLIPIVFDTYNEELEDVVDGDYIPLQVTYTQLCAEMTKLAEVPPRLTGLDPALLALLGENGYQLFKKALVCESVGLGIGAFTYYRQILDGQKNRILKKVIQAMEKQVLTEDRDAALVLMKEALTSSSFKDSAKELTAGFPPSLLIHGENPLQFLYAGLSEGVHGMSEARCLELAPHIRVVLIHLAKGLAALSESEERVAIAAKAIALFKQAAKNSKPKAS